MNSAISSQCFEISSAKSVNGRRPIKAILHEIHNDPTRYQKNGISWDEEYTLANLPSVSGMSIVAEFLSEDRDIPYAHGMTDIRDNIPLFEGATVVGHFDRGYIDDVEIDGSMHRVAIAEGTLDEMRYPKFVDWLRERMEHGGVKGSVEIVGKPENNGHIIYHGGWKEQGRIPEVYDYSGYAILGVSPADPYAIVVELNSEKAEKLEGGIMDEKMFDSVREALVGAVKDACTGVSELTEANISLHQQVADLTRELAGRDEDIAALRERIAVLEESAQNSANREEELVAEINSMVKERAISELNAALSAFSDEQKAEAKDDISAFMDNPGCVEVNSIIGKICIGIVNKQMADAGGDVDVFSMTGGDEAKGNKDIEVF